MLLARGWSVAIREPQLDTVEWDLNVDLQQDRGRGYQVFP